MIIDVILTIGMLSIPISIGVSIIIATIYYNRNYYLKTKIEYIKIKKSSDSLMKSEQNKQK